MPLSDIKIDNSLLLFSISRKTSNEMPELSKSFYKYVVNIYTCFLVCVCEFYTIYICSS